MAHEFKLALGPLARYQQLQFLRNHEVETLRTLIALREKSNDPIVFKQLPINAHYPLKNLQTLNLVTLAGKYPTEIYFDLSMARLIVGSIDRICGFGTTNEQGCERHFIRSMALAIANNEYSLRRISVLMKEDNLPYNAGFYHLISKYDSLIDAKMQSFHGETKQKYVYPKKSLLRVIQTYKDIGEYTSRPIRTHLSANSKNYTAVV